MKGTPTLHDGKPHRNLQAAWPVIECQRGCSEHVTRDVIVKIGGPTGYHDRPPIPMRFASAFDLAVWDPEKHPVDGGPYCPSNDAVSSTIVSHGTWEQTESTIILDLLASGEGILLDIGAQLGWYSALASAAGHFAYAIECDPLNVGLCRGNIARNGNGGIVIEGRIGVDAVPLPKGRIRIAKIDIEGAEPEAIEWLDPKLAAGEVDALLIELSPVFCSGYDELALDLVRTYGYAAYSLPGHEWGSKPLAVNPGDLLRDLEPLLISGTAEKLAATVNSCGQMNALFVAPWLADDR